MLRAQVVLVLVCVGLALQPGNVYAQTSQPTLVDLMSNVFLEQVVLARTPAGVGVVAHTPVFANDPTVTSVTALIQQVSQQIGSQISQFPLGSSSGGFTYRYDASLGTFTRSTETFGPAFAERAATVGKQKLSVGMNYQHGKYTALDGKDLENGDINFYLLHQPLNPRSFVEGDVIETGLRMKVTSDTTVFYANYGVTDAFDVGLAVPVEHVSLDLTYHATILDFASKVVSPSTHLFGNGLKTQDFTSSGSASGIGDVVVRAKYAFPEARGLAAGLDLRLPTGDEQNMLGTGATQAQLFLIGSTTRGNLAPHMNLGYTFASDGGGASDQFNYVGGTEYAATPKVTVVGDLIGRTFRNTQRLKDVSVSHTYQQGATAPIQTTTLQEVVTETGNLTTVLGAAGIKFNAWQNLLVSAHVVVALTDAGLRSRVTPVVGFDYSF